ncbi:MAG: hypothetical protein J4N26_04160, partial [Chloroflexi bacterium]|nr:hypothetical protein [Chloroflexota bacterium]
EIYDFDLDGCPDADELRNNPEQGGLRDPFNPWDRQDVDKDGFVNIPNDILPTAAQFGPVVNAAGASLDRSGVMFDGAGSWSKPGQDGVVNIVDDILGTAAQFGHTCTSRLP